MAVVIPDISPPEFLMRFRGRVIVSRPAYPEVLHLHVRDADGGIWRFATFEADYIPAEPEAFLGKMVDSVDLDASSAGLTIGFSDGTSLAVVPFSLTPDEIDDSYESWQLFTPDGLVLDYGPGEHWVLGRASDPA
jgi:hypothetical protein